jgi:tetratricopeptide (TPR) repeat protein
VASVDCDEWMTMNKKVDADDFCLDDVVPKRNQSVNEDVIEPVSRRTSNPSGNTKASDRGEEDVRRRGWRINYWLLAGTVLVLVVLGPSLYLWRNYQVERNAVALVRRAQALEAEEKWREAGDFYHRYLQLVPDDTEVIVARAEAFDKSASSPDRANRAITLLLQAVDVAPENVELRMRLADRLFEQGRWNAARLQAERILELQPESLTAARIVALGWQAQLGPGRSVAIKDVADAHVSALEKHPGDPVLSNSLATVYRQNLNSFADLAPDDVEAQADSVIDTMITVHPSDPEVFLARYRYRRTYDLDGADDDLERALELAPESPEVLLAASAKFLREDPGRSMELAKRLLEVAPAEVRGYQMLAEVQSRLGNVDDAIGTLRQGLDQMGGENYLLQRSMLEIALADGRIELADETRKGLESWRRRVAPYLSNVERRRLDEDLQVAKARQQLLAGEYRQAVSILKGMDISLAEGSDADENLRRREQRLRLLAEAHGQLQQWDLAAEAMAEASRLRPTSYESLLSEARFVRQGGDLQRSTLLVQEAALKPDAPSEIWLAVAEMLIESEFQRAAPEARDWRRVRAALERARPTLEGSPAYVSLQARWALADQRPEDAVAELSKILPVENVPLDSAGELALLFAAAGDVETADSLVSRLLADPEFAARGEQARVEILERNQDYEAARQRLEDFAAEGLEVERQDLIPRLISLELEGGYVQEARQRLSRMREQGPTTVPLLEFGATLAMQGKDWQELDKYIRALERLEGANGTVWRFYQALAYLEDRPGSQGMDITEAGRLLRKLEELRPQWVSNLIVKGRLAERRGDIEEGVAHYLDAANRGARSVIMMDWLLSGLYRQNRFDEAIGILRIIGPGVSFSSQLSGAALPAYFRQGRTEDALRIARVAAELHANDAIPQIRYGQALTVAGELDRAEERFRLAMELAPRDERSWAGMIWFFAQTRQFDRARELLKEIAESAPIPPTDRTLLVARGNALIGSRIVASERYEEVLAARPDDPAILEEVARFHLQWNAERALRLYRRLLAISPDSMVARRAIALILSLRGSEQEVEEALQLLGDRESTPRSLMDERLEAVILMRGGESQRARAVEQLTRLVEDQPDVGPVERLLLARALELAGQQDAARNEYEKLLSKTPTPDAVNMFVAYLLRQQQYDMAEEWLQQLEEQGGEANAANNLSLRAELLAGMDRHQEIGVLVQDYVTRWEGAEPADRRNAMRLGVSVLRQHGLVEDEERLTRAFAEIDPAGRDGLISFLIRRERMGEALREGLDFSSRNLDERPPLALLQVMTLLAARKATMGLLQEDAEIVFEKAKGIHGNDLRFLFDLGTLRVMQGRDDEAIELYEEALRIRPEYLPAMNNLSILLSLIPERRDEALAMIQRLKMLAPDSTEVMDSHALVLMGCEQYVEAREILASLLADHPENARFKFHLAVVEDQLGNSEVARALFHAALGEGLEQELLTPVENEYAAQLQNEYGLPASDGAEED